MKLALTPESVMFDLNRESLIRRYEHNYFRDWVVSTKRRGKGFTRYFSDQPRGRATALRAAHSFRDKLGVSATATDRNKTQICSQYDGRNRSCRRKRNALDQGSCWCATWRHGVSTMANVTRAPFRLVYMAKMRLSGSLLRLGERACGT